MSKNCPKCGTVLPAQAPSGPCPACRRQCAAEPAARWAGGAGIAKCLAGAQRLFSQLEYKSRATCGGVPWVHVALGIDPVTRQRRWASGIFAVGGGAQGVVAVGGMAVGVVAVGGLAVGVFACGGLGMGVVAMGGLAVALLAGIGGGALAPIAIGGGACGGYAYGAGALGLHACSRLGADARAWEFFQLWVEPLLLTSLLAALGMLILALGLELGVLLWGKERNRIRARNPASWIHMLVLPLSLGACLLSVGLIQFIGPIPQLWLISGRVLEAQTGQPLPGVTIGLVSSTNEIQPRLFAHSQADGQFTAVLEEPAVGVVPLEYGYQTNLHSLPANAFSSKRHAQIDLRLERRPENEAREAEEKAVDELFLPERLRR